MSPYIEASDKGIAFCWSCTRTQLLAECGLTRTSEWKMRVQKYKLDFLQETLDSMKTKIMKNKCSECCLAGLGNTPEDCCKDGIEDWPGHKG